MRGIGRTLLAALLPVLAGALAYAQPSGSPTQQNAEPTAAELTPYADRPSFRVREWTLSDGIPTPVEAVAQTPDGYLWMATDEGLFRFDGVRFTPVTTETNPVFQSNRILSLTVLPSGDLWVGTRDRWSYRLHDGEWSAFSLDEAFRGEHWVQGFAADADGTVWAASTGPYLARFDGERWTRFTDALDLSWPHFSVDAEGRIWTKLYAELLPGHAQALIGGDVIARMDGERLVPVDDDRLLGFAASQNGPILHRTDAPVDAVRDAVARGERVCVDLTDAAGRLLTWIWFDSETARAMLVDRAGRAWVQLEDAQNQNELIVVKDGRELARFAPDAATWFEGVFEDRQGGFWTYSTGTGLLQIVEEPFRRYTTHDGVPRYAARVSPTAEGGVIVSTLGQSNEVRTATIDGGQVTTHLVRPVPNSETFEEWTSNGAISLGQVIEDARGQRWGVAGPHLFRIADDRAEWVVTVGRVRLRDLAPDPSDPSVIWTADIHGGIFRIDTETGAVTDSLQIPDPSGGTEPLLVWDLHHTADGRLLAATARGLLEVQPGPRLQPFEGLSDREVYGLTEDSDGVLWAPTDAGLARIRGGEIAFAGREEGLPTDAFSTVLLDEVGYLWLAQGPRLHRIRRADVEAAMDGAPQEIDVVTLLSEDGLLPPARSIWSHAKDPGGGLWLPSPNGAMRIDPVLYAQQHTSPLQPIPETVVTEAGEAYAFTEGLELPLGARTLTFSYNAVDVLAPRLIRFRTRLVGHNAAWVDRGNARSAVVGGLEPGRYRFQVQAMNAGGVWSEPVEAATIVVPAHVWETGWFAALCVLAVGLVLGGGYRVRIRQVRQRELALEATVDARTAELQAAKRKTEEQAAQLRALDVAKSRFFANVSHEFRTPLTLTLGPLEDVRAGTYGSVSDEASRQLDLALNNSRRLLRLVDQLLDVARIESGALKLDLQPGDLRVYVRTLAQPFVAAAERRRVDFIIDTSAQPLWACFDPSQLDKAIINLLSNALKFTPEGGSVHVVVRQERGVGIVAVRDTGPGIAPEHRPYLFDRFFQSEKSEMQPGTGIGLALAKNVAELHGGSLRVESEVGVGSEFILQLPLIDLSGDGAVIESHRVVSRVAVPTEGATGEPTSADVDAPGSDPDDDRTTVLVVDDNADIRTYLRSHLERGGRYRVIEAEDGEAALAAVRSRLPDLVVSDVMMPRRDGFSLLEALRADPETDFVPVILLTARAEAEDRLAGLGLGADDYVSKPFDALELSARIDNLIAMRQRLRERYADAPPPLAVRSEETDLASADQEFLDSLEAAVTAHLAEDDFDVNALAEAVGQSRSTLHRRLADILDEPPSAFLRRRRLERGAQLLSQHVGTISEVAYAVGFKSVSHFSSSFKRHLGMTPTAWIGEHTES